MLCLRSAMLWRTVAYLLFLSGVFGTSPSGTDNFYNYRSDYDNEEYSSGGYDGKIGRNRDYTYEDEESDYRGSSDDWVGGSRRGWSTPPSSSFAFNRLQPRPNRPYNTFPKPASTGWDEEDTPWSPSPPRRKPEETQWPTQPPRRKPAYVVKIRRPVKKDPAWVYFRPPNPGRVPSGWKRPVSPSKRPLSPDKVSSWEEDPTASHYANDASYSFAFDAGDHDRREYSDPYGTVTGSYSYVDPTGLRRTIHYTAGSETGFKVLKSSPSNIRETVYRDPVVVRRKPSAFVYHLHPDGGWKPWEGRNDPPLKETPLIASTVQPEEEFALDESRFEPQPPQKYADDQQRRHHYPTAPDDDKVDVRGYEGGYGDKNPLIVLDDKRISPGKMMAQRMRRRKQHADENRRRDRDRPNKPPASAKSQRQKAPHRDN